MMDDIRSPSTAAISGRDDGDGFAAFLADLRRWLPGEHLIEDAPRRLAYGTDASFYRLTPRLVVRPGNEAEMVRLLQAAHRHRVPLTFRAAGTSLSGQAVTASVLVQVDARWRRLDVFDEGARIRLQPGLTGAQANRALAPYGRRIGPDPASIDAAMIGGIAANNASGMCCGIDQNSYRTLAGMRMVLHDGYVLDSTEADAGNRLHRERPQLWEGLAALGRRVRAHAGLSERIRHKYRIKNTTGYSLNALLDYEDPVDILSHLMIGSEGTLGFIAEITYRTVVEPAHRAAALAFFADVHGACSAAAALREAPVVAVELIDRAALRAIEGHADIGVDLRALPDGCAALLVEARADDVATLAAQIDVVQPHLDAGAPLSPVEFSRDAQRIGALWRVRKGLFPALGHMRTVGTTLIIEDIAVPVSSLADAVMDLQALFDRHGYDDAIIFGHARDGNLHFVFSQSFDDPAEVERYAAFMDDVSRMVAGRHDGSLKAEHGTGRNMAPFVEAEWGAQAYALMRELKTLLDPRGILNPGVILSDDPKAHVRHLKPMPAADPMVDQCTECGFCEPVCPSRDLTLTPRQRIVLWRRIRRLEHDGGDPAELAEMRRAFDYLGDRTCATDGLCATRCPLDIDTGALITDLRRRAVRPLPSRLALRAARRMDRVTAAARGALRAGRSLRGWLGAPRLTRWMAGLRRLSGGRLPRWNAAIPAPVPVWVLPPPGHERPRVVYLPSCLARTFGAPGDDREPGDALPQVVARVLNRAGFDVLHPPALSGLCCGKAFEGMGYADADAEARTHLLQALEAASGHGRHPILCDTSPCLKRMRETLPSHLRLYDPIEFADAELLDRLPLQRLPRSVLLHVNCSARHLGLAEAMRRVAQRCADEVVEPPDVECCGFAGSKGFLTPELNMAALRPLNSAQTAGCSGGYSTSVTCEIGLTDHTGLPYRSLFHLLDEASAAALVSSTDAVASGVGGTSVPTA